MLSNLGGGWEGEKISVGLKGVDIEEEWWSGKENKRWFGLASCASIEHHFHSHKIAFLVASKHSPCELGRKKIKYHALSDRIASLSFILIL